MSPHEEEAVQMLMESFVIEHRRAVLIVKDTYKLSLTQGVPLLDSIFKIADGLHLEERSFRTEMKRRVREEMEKAVKNVRSGPPWKQTILRMSSKSTNSVARKVIE